MPISTDELFAEDFKPEWMTRPERIKRQLWGMGIRYHAEYRYRMEAAESRLRLASRTDAKGNYHNGAFRCIKKRR